MKKIVISLAAAAVALAVVFAFLIMPESGASEPSPTPEPTAVIAATPVPTPIPTPEPTPEPTPPPAIKIVVAGDVLTGEKIGPRIAAGEYDAVLDADTAERFRNADIALINLETSVSERGSPADKTYTFRSPPENLAFLRDYLGIDAASLANNHALDYGRDAFEDTLIYTREYGITPVGGGEDLDTAAAPYIAEVGDKKIAVFASNQILPAVSWTASGDRAGQLVTKDPKNLGILEENIKAARETCDFIIVYLHWGIERDSRPNATQKNTAHALIDLGVDVVIGSHPHIIQSFEYYNGKPIIYSLGNFIFNSRNPQTAFAEITIDGGEVAVRLVPCKMTGTLTYAAPEDEAAELLIKWSELSINAAFDEFGVLRPAAAEPAEG
ncbi:MAG: CapA family protein [Oscillospiraceae bacterium]|nr:CapA family protein [Oscillospiraceae bacterium]